MSQSGYASASHGLAGATVLQIVPAMRGDRIGRAALSLAAVMLRAGARALVAGEGGPLVGELQAVGGEWMEHAFGDGHLFKRRRTARSLQNLVAAERVELVLAYGADLTRHALAAAKPASVPVIASCPGLPAQKPRRMRADPLAQANVVLTLSEYAAGRLTRDHGVAAEHIGVIPHSIDLAWFDATSVGFDRVGPLRQAWRIAPHERVVLAPGRVAPGSGHLGLVDALRILVNGGLRDIVVVVVGEEADEEASADALRTRVRAQGLGACVRYAGQCSDMPAAYAAADLVVLPAERAATFDERACEALAMGRPVVASQIGALPELVLTPPRVPEEARTGWLVRPRDAFELARTLAVALSVESEAWLALGANGRRVAERKYSAMRVTDATLAVCGALLDGEAYSAHRR